MIPHRTDANRDWRQAPLRLLVASLAAVCLAGLALPVGAAATGRIQGTAADEDGNAVSGLRIKFVEAGESGKTARTLKTDKKGTFSHNFFPIGDYRVELEDEEKFLKSVTFVEYDENGIEINRTSGDAHPERGLPPFHVGFGHRVKMEIVIASEAYRAELAQKVAIAEASGPLKKMMERYDAGDMKAVVEETDKLLKEHPELGVAYYLRGLAQSRLGDADAAIESLRRALELVPEQQGVAGALGTVLLQEGKVLGEQGDEDGARAAYTEAESALAQEIERFGSTSEFLANRAAALDALGRTDALIEELEKLIEADPSNVDAMLKRVDVLAKSGRYDDALAALRDLPAGDKGAAVTAYNVAAGFYNAGEIPKAIAAADRGLAFDPDLPALYRLLGRAHLSAGDNDAALRALETFVSLAPNDPEVEVERELIRRIEQQKP